MGNRPLELSQPPPHCGWVPGFPTFCLGLPAPVLGSLGHSVVQVPKALRIGGWHPAS